MADFLTESERAALMGRVRSEGTGPEESLGAALGRLGLEPERNAPDLPGKPDFVFRDERLAVFVDGDLWHGHQWRERGLRFLDEQFRNRTNRAYWIKKVQGNVRRDIRRTRELLDAGWSVLRFWESGVAKPASADRAAAAVARSLRGEETPARGWIAGSGLSADFFAGIGLMSRGLREGGWRTAWANDYDAKKRRLYLHNAGAERVELEARSILDVGPGSVPRVGLIAACFPCTDLSLAGGRKGIEEGAQSSTYLRFADILSRMRGKRPAFVILENVLGLVTAHGGRDFEVCLTRLAEAGYVVDAIALDARRFTAQSRPRLFIVGVRREAAMGPFLDEAERARPSSLRPAALASFIGARPGLPWAVRPLPDPPEGEARLAGALDEFDPGSEAWWAPERVERLRAQTSEAHRERLARLVEGSGVASVTAFRRMRRGKSTLELRFDGLAGCLRTPKGGSAKQILVRADADGWRARYLSAAECARLMGADGFRTDAEGISENDALFGFGDAVCVPAVEWLIRNHVNPVAAELIRGRLLRPEVAGNNAGA